MTNFPSTIDNNVSTLCLESLSLRHQQLIGVDDDPCPVLQIRAQRLRTNVSNPYEPLNDVFLLKETEAGDDYIFVEQGLDRNAFIPGTVKYTELVAKIEDAIDAWHQAQEDIAKEFGNNNETPPEAEDKEVKLPYTIESEGEWGGCEIVYSKTVLWDGKTQSHYVLTHVSGESSPRVYSTVKEIINSFPQEERERDGFEREIRSFLSSLRSRAS